MSKTTTITAAAEKKKMKPAATAAGAACGTGEMKKPVADVSVAAGGGGDKTAAAAVKIRRYMRPEVVNYFLEWENEPLPRVPGKEEACDFFNGLSDDIADSLEKMKEEYYRTGRVELHDCSDDDDD